MEVSTINIAIYPLLPEVNMTMYAIKYKVNNAKGNLVKPRTGSFCVKDQSPIANATETNIPSEEDEPIWNLMVFSLKKNSNWDL
jgi:hypothetical protein